MADAAHTAGYLYDEGWNAACDAITRSVQFYLDAERKGATSIGGETNFMRGLLADIERQKRGSRVAKALKGG